VGRESIPEHRSGCPVSISLEVLGDRWSLLMVRDMMVRGYRTFREFQHAGEGIASNILADRLRKLEASGILTTELAVQDGRSAYYRLTAKGIALVHVLLDLLIWGSKHEATAVPCSFIAQMEQNREAVLAETYRRWVQRDTTPLIPPFNAQVTSAGDTAEARGTPRTRRVRNQRSSPITTTQEKSSLKGKLKR
jgi:DNA-binding HxlR family transcriptional regulator